MISFDIQPARWHICKCPATKNRILTHLVELVFREPNVFFLLVHGQVVARPIQNLAPRDHVCSTSLSAMNQLFLPAIKIKEKKLSKLLHLSQASKNYEIALGQFF
jgi:hypothetical protein